MARIVEACTDTDEVPKPPWRARKDKFLASLEIAPEDAVLVVLADKVHNARTLLLDYRTRGEAIWSRFHGGREGTLWYLRQMVEALAAHGRTPLLDELERTVAELERLAARADRSS